MRRVQEWRVDEIWRGWGKVLKEKHERQGVNKKGKKEVEIHKGEERFFRR